MDAGVTVRLIVADVAASVVFYTGPLGFTKETETPAFAAVLEGTAEALSQRPDKRCGEALPDGTVQAPGGWGRVMLPVADIGAEITRLKAAGVIFRGDPVAGPAGTFAILDDPSGNPVELWQAAEHH